MIDGRAGPGVRVGILALAAGLALGACRAAPVRRDAAHPASPQAAVGRLAGPPAVLGAPPADLITAPRPDAATP